MQDFYLTYKKVGKKYLVRSNLTKEMMRNAGNYEELDLITLSLTLNKLNSMGDAVKKEFKNLCNKNGNPLHNAIYFCYGYEEINENTYNLVFANNFNDLCQKFLSYKPIKF